MDGVQIQPQELMAGLSRALDLTEGEPMGHSIRACWIGMRIGRGLGLESGAIEDLFYGLLLKDAGCSANAHQVSSWFGTDDQDAKADLKQVNWSRMADAVRYAVRNTAPHAPWPRRVAQLMTLARRGVSLARDMVEIRCTRGAEIVKALGWSGAVPEAVLNLDEHWDGSGYPRGAKGEEIPLLARVLLFSQTVEIFWRKQGAEAARAMASNRRGTWFDPALVDVFLAQSRDPQYFSELAGVGDPESIHSLFPDTQKRLKDVATVMNTAEIFGQIVDAKSPWTRLHSHRTAAYAKHIAVALGLPTDSVQEVQLAAFFHDLGKLGVSNVILDKPGQLTAAERQSMEQHPRLTYEILAPLAPLAPITYAASCHHERLDGSGYYRQLSGGAVPVSSQIVAVADVFDALTADRPYRSGLSPEDAFKIIGAQAGHQLSQEAYEALRSLDLNPSLEAAPLFELS